jgi:hypothetical protein
MSFTKYATVCAGAALSIALHATSAHAMTWVRDDQAYPGLPGPGCAQKIAVGPNNVPWIIGCDQSPYPPNQPIRFLDCAPCDNCLFPTSCTWQDAQGDAVDVMGGVNGSPVAITSNGHAWQIDIDANSPNTDVPAIPYQWYDLTANNAGCGHPLGGCVTQMFTSYTTTPQQELWMTPVLDSPPSSCVWKQWALGCGGGPDHAIYEFDGADGAVSWSRVDPQQNAAATHLALFGNGTAANQVPWVSNSLGAIYGYDSFLSQFVAEPNPGLALSLTDHFVLTRRSARDADQNVFQWSDSTQSWSQYITGTAPNNARIVEIAAASSMNDGSYGIIGPSKLWGIDANGNIYVAQEAGSGQ